MASLKGQTAIVLIILVAVIVAVVGAGAYLLYVLATKGLSAAKNADLTFKAIEKSPAAVKAVIAPWVATEALAAGQADDLHAAVQMASDKVAATVPHSAAPAK